MGSQITVTQPLRAVGAVIFDTDGVITDSASVHALAWADAFGPALAAAGAVPFTGEDYRKWVDGRSRIDGAVALFEARGVYLPTGSAEDPPGAGTIHAVAARKEKEFLRRMHAGQIRAWPGTVDLLRALSRAAISCAAVSASRHATELLETTGVRTLFAAVVDGAEAARLHLPGKPDPALFQEAARRLSVSPTACAVVEDALPGVEAGRRGGFRLVVGVDRGASALGAGQLRARGADIVVRDLAEMLTTETEEVR